MLFHVKFVVSFNFLITVSENDIMWNSQELQLMYLFTEITNILICVILIYE